MNEREVRAAKDAARAMGDAVNRAGGPIGLVGRTLGFGEAEIRAGIPKWAWFSAGFITGAAASYLLHDRIAAAVSAKS